MITVWGDRKCFLCSRMTERLTAAGIDFTFKEFQPVLDGKCQTEDFAMLALVEKYVASGSRKPIIDVDGKLMSYPEAVNWLKSNTIHKEN